jgi:hypothetical protein
VKNIFFLSKNFYTKKIKKNQKEAQLFYLTFFLLEGRDEKLKCKVRKKKTSGNGNGNGQNCRDIEMQYKYDGNIDRGTLVEL